MIPMNYLQLFQRYIKKLLRIKIMEQIIVVEQELELLKRIVKEKEDALFCLKCEFVDEKDS